MTDKEKIRKEVERRILAIENREYQIPADNVSVIQLRAVLSFIDSLQEEPATPKVLEDMLNAKTTAESLGISQEEHDRIVDKLIYGKEPELVDVDDLPNKEKEPVSETNRVVQVRRCLEEVATTINPFIEEVVNQFNMKDDSITSKEIQYRGIGLKSDFGENIHRSDDEIIYILKEDKAVGLIIIRRTEFNNAEITMIKTEERFKTKQND